MKKKLNNKYNMQEGKTNWCSIKRHCCQYSLKNCPLLFRIVVVHSSVWKTFIMNLAYSSNAWNQSCSWTHKSSVTRQKRVSTYKNQTALSQNRIWNKLFAQLTLCTLTSACIFSILFSLRFLWCWQREFV